MSRRKKVLGGILVAGVLALISLEAATRVLDSPINRSRSFPTLSELDPSMRPEAVGIMATGVLYQTPQLLVSGTACVVAFRWWRRSPAASTLVLFGAGLAAAGAIVPVLVKGCAWELAYVYGRGWARNTGMMEAYVACGDAARAIGMGLVIAAVYVGRRDPAEDARRG